MYEYSLWKALKLMGPHPRASIGAARAVVPRDWTLNNDDDKFHMRDWPRNVVAKHVLVEGSSGARRSKNHLLNRYFDLLHEPLDQVSMNSM